MRVYFRNKGSVFFSLLGVLIVIAIYVLFLLENLVSNFPALEEAELLVSTWLIAGISAITPLTTSLGALGVLVDDRAGGISKDFLASPIARWKLAGGYLAGGLAAGLVMTAVMLLAGGGYLALVGYEWPGLETIVALVGVQLLSVLSGGAMMFFLVTFFRSNAGYTGVSTLVGTLVGFLTGIYLPIGTLPEAMQWVVRLFPTSHAAALTRYLLLESAQDKIFSGLPADAMRDVWLQLGVRFEFGEQLLPLWASAAILAGSAVLFFALSTLSYGKSKA